ncbi:MAG: FHA domain-containing protein, partial [Gemmatimonadetes bacterium]|nr:FHA domain-containing protein [Gemmatimonadota bacterium]
DVVIASGEVSRNHAEISSGPDGYYIIDTSTNGIWVNGKRVDGTQTLGRADVIRIGPEEFRFYADKAQAAAAKPAAAPAPAPAPPPAPAPAPAPVAAAPAPAPAPAAPPPAPAPAPKAPLATTVPEVPKAPAPPSAPPPPSAPAAAPAQKGSPVIWILVGVVAIAAAAYFLLLK